MHVTWAKSAIERTVDEMHVVKIREILHYLFDRFAAYVLDTLGVPGVDWDTLHRRDKLRGGPWIERQLDLGLRDWRI